MDFNVTTDKYKQEAYDLIKSIYKFIPFYNQIKGTYLGVQFILNTMGLCVSITELWSDKTNINNFSADTVYYREDEINAVRKFIQDIGEDGKKLTDIVLDTAYLNNLYLTSKFDIDIHQAKNIKLADFYGMAGTIVDTIMQIRPVTRCLRKLYYFFTINTDLHFRYNYNGDGVQIEDNNQPDDKYGLKIRTFHYIWDVTNRNGDHLIDYDSNTQLLNYIKLPYMSLAAKCHDPQDSIPEYTNEFKNTFKNTYFNLYKLGNKLKASGRMTFRFKLYIRKKTEYNFKFDPEYPEYYQYILLLAPGDGVVIESYDQGIIIKFNGYVKRLLSSAGIGSDNIDDYDIYLATTFSMVLGTDYVYQIVDFDKEPINWDMDRLLNRYPGLITEVSTNVEPDFIEAEGSHDILLYETDYFNV
jgi:hypothetical protein